MNPLLIAPIFELGKGLIDRWFPDPAKKAEAEAQFMLLMQEQDFKKVLGQLEVNAKEAASPHVFVAGWRPFVGWCCGLGFLWATIGHPIVAWLATAKGWPPPPAIDTEVLLYVLGGMLGLGTLRSFEKSKGVA
ncbi:MAG: 3TM-type holin [Rubrivivax sp.]|nr:3TM-type holin [Burkholderiaceae bacterium]MDP3614766.1 3TM-type holin [Rubrivivax sp.]